MIGGQIGSYQIVRELGAGGMGTVYEGVHREIGRRAAIKLLRPDRSRDPLMAVRFLNEARAISRVEHPGLVRIFEYGRLQDGAAYLVMEHLAGETLREWLRRVGNGLGPVAVPLVRQLALALAAIHAKQIVHRDIKPENVMVLPAPETPLGVYVKLLDFGIAKLMDEPTTGEAMSLKTRTGSLLGTPTYMSPEQCRGTGCVDERADVYALGVVFYEMLCGRPPFRSEGLGELVALHMFSTPPALMSAVPTLPPQLAQLVHLMLAKKPSERPTMAEVAGRLDELAGLTWVEERGAADEAAGKTAAEAPGVTATFSSKIAAPAAFTAASDAPALSGAETGSGAEPLTAAPSRPADGDRVVELPPPILRRPASLAMLSLGLIALAGGAWLAREKAVSTSAARTAARAGATAGLAAAAAPHAPASEPRTSAAAAAPAVLAAPEAVPAPAGAELDRQQELARQELKDGRPLSAIPHLKRVLQLAPHRAAAIDLLCQAYYQAHRLQLARDSCERALAANPSSQNAQRILPLMRPARQPAGTTGSEHDGYSVEFFK